MVKSNIKKIKTAIILAAGRGARLAPLTNDIPKCLLKIGTTTIIQFQIKMLRKFEIDEIVIVTGYKEEKVREICGSKLLYIFNDNYATTNSLYSFYLAREHTVNGCIVLNSDVIFHEHLFANFLNSPYNDAIIVDYREGLGEEEMKVIVSQNKLQKISKDIAPWEAQGENVGIVKLSSKGAEKLIKAAEIEIKKGNKNLWLPQGIDKIIASHPFYATSTNNLPWIEIDYFHDLERAKKEIYPLCR